MRHRCCSHVPAKLDSPSLAGMVGPGVSCGGLEGVGVGMGVGVGVDIEVSKRKYDTYLLDIVANALHIHVDPVQLQLPLGVVEPRCFVADAPIRLSRPVPFRSVPSNDKHQNIAHLLHLP